MPRPNGFFRPGLEPTQSKIAGCLQNEPAFCTAVCPFHLDVRDFIGKMRRGGFNAAYRTYLDAVGFPGIVTALCSEPCQDACPVRLAGGAVSLRLLEKAAVNYARNLAPNSYNVPPKQKKVAIIGAGISGLACALRLAAKGYGVTMFEKTGRIGGHLHDILPPEIFIPDIERQFMHEEYELRLDTEIKDLDMPGFAAIYVASGAGGTDFGLVPDPDGAFASTRPGVFLGGSLTGAGTMHAMADGLHACGAIERFIKTAGMNHPPGMSGTKLQLDASRIIPVEAVLPADGWAYTQDEAVAEARRCLGCACDACIRSCDLMGYFRKYPRRIAEEVEITIHPGTLDGNGTVATRLISTCNQCGLCKEVCPQGIDTGGLLLQSHRIMRAKGTMPWAFHEFFLQDMAFANGEAGLCRLPRGTAGSKYVFFPGCQLGASDQRYVIESYRFLLGHWPDTALMLGCCSAPAEWAGDEAMRNEATAKLRKDWLALGRPDAVFACPMCKQMFRRHLPEIKGVFLYDLMLAQGILPLNKTGRKTASVFDPCASRNEPEVRQAIRELARKAGFSLESLPAEGRLARCCSWGGQVAVAHPAYARHVIRDRIAASGNPYITYCINCRDIFAAAKKPAWHILDILLGLNGPDRVPPTVSERRRNRIALKRNVLEEFWEEKGDMKKNKPDLLVAPELKQKMNSELILGTDIAAVIEYCEKSGRKVFDPVRNTFSGHLRIGNMTFWAEYRPLPEGGFELVNAYGHRMRIEEA